MGSKPAPDALGAHRVIPVPRSIAQAQSHLLLPVDGQAVLVDAEPGSQPRPLLLVLHGLGEDAVAMRQQTGFTALAALSGFDVAYPNAPQDSPNPPAAALAPAAVVRAAVVETPATAVPKAPAPSAAVQESASPTPTPSATTTPSPSPTLVAPSKTATPRLSSTPPRPAPKPTSTPSKAVPKPSPSPKPKRPSPLSPGTRAWNAGTCCAVQTRNDVGYLVDVVHAVERLVPIDASRVYVVGFSNGGMMALDAVCNAPQVFAAAGSVAGPFLGARCARPVWRHLAAAGDAVVPTAGGIPPGVPQLGVAHDWCGCAFPATTTETARFGPFASVAIAPGGGHFWPTPDNALWSLDPERDLWNYVSRIRL